MKNRDFDRNIRFFGQEGQNRLAIANVAIVGIGGLGTHVVQQLALLGVGKLTLIDGEEFEEVNRNRYVGARHDDPIPGTLKVGIGERLVRQIRPEIEITKTPTSFVTEQGFDRIIRADYVFGCVDNEGARLILNELCAAYSRPYFDLASDIQPGKVPYYGGRVCVAWDGSGCIVCLGLIDVAEAQEDLASPEDRRNQEALYGVERSLLDRSGPSVVSINGVVASLAVTEFMVGATGIRFPKKLLTYHGHLGKVAVSTDEPAPDCFYCKGIWGKGDAAGLERYIK